MRRRLQWEHFYRFLHTDFQYPTRKAVEASMQNLFQSGNQISREAGQLLAASEVSRHVADFGADPLKVALIGEDTLRRTELARMLASRSVGTIREFALYPALDDVPIMLAGEYDVVIVDLDGNSEHALELVESLGQQNHITVMVYSSRTDADMLVRCMRVGAREYLSEPIAPSSIAEALVRAAARRPATRPVKKENGRLIVFAGAKGGSGTTTIATNFAIALARESSQSTLLIDLGFPLGEAALELGITTQFSTLNALENYERLDTHFLSTLVAKHSSGLQLLTAPDRYTDFRPGPEAFSRLMAVACQSFAYVVVDAGSKLGPSTQSLFEEASAVYLVTQVNVAELRNANRLITEYFRESGAKLQVVLNRYTPRTLGIDEEHVTRALTKPAEWKIPGDYMAARRAQNTATPLALEDSAISRMVRQMARSACDLPPVVRKKNRFALFSS